MAAGRAVVSRLKRAVRRDARHLRDVTVFFAKVLIDQHPPKADDEGPYENTQAQRTSTELVYPLRAGLTIPQPTEI